MEQLCGEVQKRWYSVKGFPMTMRPELLQYSFQVDFTQRMCFDCSETCKVETSFSCVLTMQSYLGALWVSVLFTAALKIKLPALKTAGNSSLQQKSTAFPDTPRPPHWWISAPSGFSIFASIVCWSLAVPDSQLFAIPAGELAWKYIPRCKTIRFNGVVGNCSLWTKGVLSRHSA